MDRLSIIGLFLALASLVGGSILKGAGLSSLWSPAAFVIVAVTVTVYGLGAIPLARVLGLASPDQPSSTASAAPSGR